MNPPEENDPVWKLLNHASTTEPSPYFSRRVLREVREMGESQRGQRVSWFAEIFQYFSPRIALPALVAVAAVTLMLMFQGGGSSVDESSVRPGLVLQIGEDTVDPATEMEAVEYLGQLMAVADPGQLSDEALADLFF
ncbi:MAG: hypothetical protein AAF733_05505 [Verrucomicrobiota bacterium]